MGEMVTIFSNYALNLADCRFIFEPKSAPYLRAFMQPLTDALIMYISSASGAVLSKKSFICMSTVRLKR